MNRYTVYLDKKKFILSNNCMLDLITAVDEIIYLKNMFCKSGKYT